MKRFSQHIPRETKNWIWSNRLGKIFIVCKLCFIFIRHAVLLSTFLCCLLLARLKFLRMWNETERKKEKTKRTQSTIVSLIFPPWLLQSNAMKNNSLITIPAARNASTLISCRSSEERFPKEHFKKFPATFAICQGHIVKESKNVSRPDARWKFSNLRGAAQPRDPG